MDLDTFLKLRAKKSEAAKKKFQEAHAKNFKDAEVPTGNSTSVADRAQERLADPSDLIPLIPLIPADSSDPMFALDAIPKLMNSQVVLLMKGEVWASQKALSGYMGFHHMLLALCKRYPRLQETVEERIRCFLSNADERVKAKVPNLGEFICLLSVSDQYDWASVAAPLLGEVFDRNVLWIVKRHPELGELTDAGVSQERLHRTFHSAQVSMRLIMFNVWFLNNVAKAPHTHFGQDPEICCHASCALLRYEQTKGLPLHSTIEALHRAVKDIIEVSSWKGYFKAVGIKNIPPAALCEWLRQSVIASLRKGYHRQIRSRRELPRADEQDCDAHEELADQFD